METRDERSVVASGKTVDDAIANGLAALGARRDEVEIQVLSEGSRGVLGFGAENARVRLAVKPPPQIDAPALVQQPPAKPVTTAPPVEPVATPPPVEHVATAPPEQALEKAPTQAEEPTADELSAEYWGKELVLQITSLMGVRARVEVCRSQELAEEGEPPAIVLNLTGDDLGVLIGRRGETLRALQYLVRLMVSHRVKHWTDLVIDIEDYRVRRRHALEALARREAERVVREKRPQALEPMPAYERRIIHMALRRHPQVTTQSVGEGERRKVTIIPKQR